ncbi:ankyrin repeat domain-containing protein [Aspergillus melleus]|uniref:ankyrin repeat domain-containing protein n=1 Tax=Aspergillus melleus TaxID=138277 RepID=UPI001E8EC7B3|nr:uncharacterized protein LDX57_007832 [Aspergillus melleus]KAH8430162.1 hypothetical protein LDX57_007832 [Aspergillus melleus]
MHLFELPEEVLLSIADEIDSSTDLLSLCRTSKTLLRITLGVLYRLNIQQEGSSTLLWAASKDEITVIQALLGYGADINVKDDEGWSTVSLAAQNGHSRAVELLLMQDNLHLWSCDHRFRSTALHEAARAGHLYYVVNLLLGGKNVNVNVMDRDRRTPLWWATYSQHKAVAERLLAVDGIDVNARSRLSESANQPSESSASLHHLVCWEDNAAPLINLFVQKEGLDPNIENEQGETPLWLAAKKGDVTIVDMLLSHRDIDVNAFDRSGRSPLWAAALYGHVEVVRRLLALPATDWNQTAS